MRETDDSGGLCDLNSFSITILVLVGLPGEKLKKKKRGKKLPFKLIMSYAQSNDNDNNIEKEQTSPLLKTLYWLPDKARIE